MADPLVWSSKDVARALGLSHQKFYERVRGLQREHGFPTSLPGLRGYSVAAVTAWINRQLEPVSVPVEEGPAEDVLIARARAMVPAEQSAGG